MWSGRAADELVRYSKRTQSAADWRFLVVNRLGCSRRSCYDTRRTQDWYEDLAPCAAALEEYYSPNYDVTNSTLASTGPLQRHFVQGSSEGSTITWMADLVEGGGPCPALSCLPTLRLTCLPCQPACSLVEAFWYRVKGSCFHTIPLLCS